MSRVDAEGAQVLVLEGEPGIGKSALCSSLAVEAKERGFSVLEGRADELEGRRAFGLLGQAFGKELVGAIGERAASALLASSDSAPDRELVAIEAAIELLERRSSERAVVVVLEDLHWADSSSLVVLRGLLRRGGALPLVLLASARLAPRSGALETLLAEVGARRRLVLGPIDQGSIERLAARRCGAAIGPGLRAQLETTRGNPLFALELIDALFAEGVIGNERELSGEVVIDLDGKGDPPSLPLTVLHRLSFCSPETLDLLAQASIFGARFDPSELSRLLGRSVPAVVAGLAEARGCGLLLDDGERLAFRHDVVAKALYDDLAPSLRRALHREAARLLVGSTAPGVVAEHLMRAVLPGDEEALSWLAGDARRLAAYAPSSAVELFEQALDLLAPDSALRSSVIADLGVAKLWCGRALEGEELCRSALSLLTDPAERLSVRQCLAESLLARGRLEALFAELDKGAFDAALDPRAGAELDGLAALAHLFSGDLHQAARLAEKVEAAGESLGVVSLKVQALVIASLLAEQEAMVQEAAGHSMRAAAIAEADGSRAAHRPWPHSAAAIYCVDSDRFEQANTLLAAGRRAHERLGGRHALPVLDVVRGFSLFWSGRLDDAAVQFEAAIALGEETGTGWRAAARGLWAVAALGRGDAALASRLVEEARLGLSSKEAPYRIEWLAFAEAFVREAEGDLEGALVALSPFAERFATRPTLASAPVAPTLCRLALACRRRVLAEPLQASFEALAKANPGVSGFSAAAQHLSALLSGELDAFARAISSYALAGRLFERAICEVEAALTLERSGREDEARKVASEALEGYRLIGAPAFAEAAASRLALRVPGPPPAGEPEAPASSAWDALTTSETRVLRLVAERRTNAEIAATLLVSKRTVETHVSHVLRKVGLHSRLELAEESSRHFGWQLRLDGGSPAPPA